MVYASKQLSFLVILTIFSIPNILGANRKCLSCSTGILGKVCAEFPLALGNCDSETGHCYTKVVRSTELIRGCVGDKIIPTLDKCSDPENCVFCSQSDDCNREQILPEKCYHGSYDKTHPYDLSASEPIDCPLAPIPLGCYDEMKSGVRVKGCLSSMSTEEIKACKSNPFCDTCHGDGCNNRTGLQRQCFKCNTEMSYECLEPTQKTRVESCDGIKNLCIVGIDEDGVTHRGCVDDADMKALTINETCKEDFCNGKMYPENRLKCIQCGNSEECDEITPENSDEWKLLIGICKNYKKNDECYSFLDTTRDNVVRGCMSDNLPYSAVCEELPNKCKKCRFLACNSIEKSTIPSSGPMVESGESLHSVDSGESVESGISLSAEESDDPVNHSITPVSNGVSFNAFSSVTLAISFVTVMFFSFKF